MLDLIKRTGTDVGVVQAWIGNSHHERQLVLARARRAASTANQGNAEDWTTGGRLQGGHPVNEELGRPCPSRVIAFRSSCSYRHRALRHGLFRSASLRRRRGRAGPRDAMAPISWAVYFLSHSTYGCVGVDRRCLGATRCLTTAVAPSTRQLATLPSPDFSFMPLQHGLVKMAN